MGDVSLSLLAMLAVLTLVGTGILYFLCFVGGEDRAFAWHFAYRLLAFVLLLTLGLYLDFYLLTTSVKTVQEKGAHIQTHEVFRQHWNAKGYSLQPQDVDFHCDGDLACRNDGKLHLTDGRCRTDFELYYDDSKPDGQKIEVVVHVFDQPGNQERLQDLTDDQVEDRYHQVCKKGA